MTWIDKDLQSRPVVFKKLNLMIDKQYYDKGVLKFGKNKFHSMITKESGLCLNGITLEELEENWGLQ